MSDQEFKSAIIDTLENLFSTVKERKAKNIISGRSSIRCGPGGKRTAKGGHFI